MTAAGRQDATGGATALQLFNAITDPNATTCQVQGTVSGWVFSQNFTIAIDPGTASEEKILCSAITGSGPSTISFLTRGYDGTVPTTHGQGAKVTHVLPAAIVQDLERHIYNAGEDDHTQYLTSTRHASPANHEFGSPAQDFAFGAGVTIPAAVAAAAAAGSGANPARDDHVHAIGAGAIDVFTQFDAGVIGGDADVATVGRAAAAGGTIAKVARIDHVHPVQVPLGALTDAGVGVSTMTYAQIDALSGTGLWAGRTVWQTDTGTNRPFAGVYVYDGTSWRLAWNQPWGVLLSKTVAANQGPFTAITDLTGLSGSWTIVANRAYEVTFSGKIQSSNPSEAGRLEIFSNTLSVVLDYAAVPVTLAAIPGTGFCRYVDSTLGAFTAGTHSVKCRANQAGSSTGNMTFVASSAQASLLVKDIGPVGSPV